MKNKTNFVLKAVALVAVTAGIVTSGFEMRETKATVSAPSGKCGALLTTNNAGLSAKLSTWTNVGTSTMATFDFDAGTVAYEGVDINNYNATNAASVANSGNASFTIAAQSDFAGHYLLTIEGGSQFNLVSTNSGNTILMSEVSNSTNTSSLQTGVCQAL